MRWTVGSAKIMLNWRSQNWQMRLDMFSAGVCEKVLLWYAGQVERVLTGFPRREWFPASAVGGSPTL